MASFQSVLLVLGGGFCFGPKALATVSVPIEAHSFAHVDEVRDLVNELLKAGEGVRQDQLQLLASIGNKEAVKGLHKVVDELRNRQRMRQAYNAFKAFSKRPEAAELAVKLLRKDSLSHRQKSHQLGAAIGLAGMGAVAHEALVEVTQKSKDENIRRTTVVPIIGLLAERGDGKSIDLLLDNASLEGRDRTRVAEALIKVVKADPSGAGLATELAERLSSRKASASVKSLLLEVLAEDPSEVSIEAIASCIHHDSPEVQLAAIGVLGKLGRPEDEPGLESLTRSKDDAVVRAAIGALGQILQDDPEFLRKASRWSKDKRPGARMGACLALAYATDQNAAVLLRELMTDDEDWRVRAEAIQQVAAQRRVTDIPILIKRLAAEKGRLSSDLVEVLRSHTGLDHGLSAARWNAWWTGEGQNFQMPTLKEAQVAQAKRKERSQNGRSAASFYGLSIRSSSIAFVVDVSGSMQALVRGSASTRNNGATPTRIDKAREQLERAVEGLADGVLFNIILFGTRATSWSPDQRTMTDKTRSNALAFIEEMRIAGGTNTFGGLMLAFDNEEVDTIYLLSDGRPGNGLLINPADIRERIRLINSVRKVRIHCISIGTASPFMRGLAEDTGGRSIVVN